MHRCLFLVSVWIAAGGFVGSTAGSSIDRQEPIGRGEGMFPYRFDRGDIIYEDLVILSNGARRIGKVLEWANQILLYDAAGRAQVFPLEDVELFETRRKPRHQSKPQLPDWTVAYIERLPRDPHWHGHVSNSDGLSHLDLSPDHASWQPQTGSNVTFRIHVLNAGAVRSASVPCRVYVDDALAIEADLLPSAPGTEQVVEAPWSWQSGPHTLRVEIDPEGRGEEIVRWNNTFIEPIRALGVAVVVARDRYEAFKAVPNLVDSFCFEDYIQYHLRTLNALFAASAYPSASEGVLERLRCDRMAVVNDPDDPAARGKWWPQLRRGGKADGLAEYAVLLTLAQRSGPEESRYDALKVDWQLLQRIGLQLGLIDLTGTDTALADCYVFDKHERYAQRRHISPLLRTLMYTPAGFPLDEPSACFLNKVLGRPRGFQGEYLYQLPKRSYLEIVSNAGRPLPNVQVDVFQLQSEGEAAGTIRGLEETDPLFTTISDARGRAALANVPTPAHKTPNGYELGPNPFGKIATDGSNGLLLLRLRSGESEAFSFLPLSVCNTAYLRGHREAYTHRVPTRFASSDAPLRPPHASVLMPDRSTEKPPLTVSWKLPEDAQPDLIEEFRIYKRTGFAGQETRPWTLMSSVSRADRGWDLRSRQRYFDEFSYDGPFSLDTFFAVSLVDKLGRESELSEPGYLCYGKDILKFAVDGMAAYITVQGPGPVQLLYWDGVAGTQPYSVKTDRFPGYQPGFEGIAFTPDHRLIAVDPKNHVLATYDTDRHEMIGVIPKRNTWPGAAGTEAGEFSSPADVAVDEEGNLYVADRGNHRVQILEANGKFKGLVDADFRFRRPHALGYANGHLCVTDKSGTRCRVYDLRPTPPTFVRELPPLFDADRGLVNKKGKVFITGRNFEDGEWGLLSFLPSGRTALFEKVHTEGQMGKFFRPRSLYLYRGLRGEVAYLVNAFPFDVRRVNLERLF